MSYTYISKYSSPNFWAGRPQGKPNHITIHHWGDPSAGATFQGVISYLCRQNGDSSAHYVVEAGKVACIVDPDNRAWHAGTLSNPRGIGIECNPRCSAQDRETVAELIADLRKTYGNLPLKKHKDFMNTACPGAWGNYLEWLNDRANQIMKGSKPTTTAKPVAEPNIEQLARDVIAGKYGNGATRKAKLGANYTAVQQRVNQILGTKPAAEPNIEQLARDVIAGKYGNGTTRKAKLGANYMAVQARVNQILAGR